MIKKVVLNMLVASVVLVGLCTETFAISVNQKSNSFIENPHSMEGWIKVGPDWYNFDSQGLPKTGWLEYEGNWYYMWSNGTMAYNTWLTNGDAWYYFDCDGKMVTSNIRVDKYDYDFTKLGAIFSK